MSKPYNDKGWSSHIKELQKFKEKFGHCNVRRTQKEFITLSYWIRRVRGLYKLRKAGKRTTLTDERIQELEDLGFGWEGWSANRSDVFQTRLKELQEFHKLHGHCRLPSPHPENPSLKSWANSIRQKFRQQSAGIGKATLTPWQIEQLEAVGFEFDASTAAAESRASHWKKHMQTLKEYKEANGHCQVPLDYPENPSLGQWAAWLKHEWESMQNGEGTSLLTAGKIAELEAIGFFSRPEEYTTNLSMDEESSVASNHDDAQSLDHEEVPPERESTVSQSVLSRMNVVTPTNNNPFSSLASLAEICRVVSEKEARNSQQHQSASSVISPQQQEEEGEVRPDTKKPPPAAAVAGARKRKSKEGYGHWTQAEHLAFLQGLEEFGRKWTKIASKIPSRSTSQVRSHAQKYFDKIKRDQEEQLNHQHPSTDMMFHMNAGQPNDSIQPRRL